MHRALYHAVVRRRVIDDNGNPVGKANDNPILDTRQYEVEFLDGTTEILTANTIADNLLSQVDDEGHKQLLLSKIIDHQKYEDAISQEDGTFTTFSGQKRKRTTTKGWELCVEWKDGSHTLVPLKDLKNSNPVELAQYASNNNLQDEPAFAWWVPYVLKKRQQILSKAKFNYWKRTHNYGIKVPKTVEEALKFDKENNNNLWRDAINEEMKKVKGSFELIDGDPSKLVGYQHITTHFIFDIKLG